MLRKYAARSAAPRLRKQPDLGRTPQDGAAERRGGANPHRLEDYDGEEDGGWVLLEKVEGEAGPSGVAETNQPGIDQPEEEQGEDAWEEWEARLEEEMHDQMVDPFEVDQREVDQQGA